MGNNLVKMTDARGVVVEYTYDALNRLTNTHYPADSTKDVTYAYDQGTYGMGRLSSITDESGQITYSYDHRGNINQETRVIDGVSYITNYTYDLADNLATMTYPSGRVVDYSDRDAAGQLNGIDEGSNTVIELVDHQPFGQPTDWTYGNGVEQSMVVDLDGRYDNRLLDSTGGVLESWTYDYSVVGNLEEIDKDADSELYEYDGLDRLWRQTPIGESQIEYGYDAASNRLTETQGASTITNTYATNSNRLLTQDGASVVHDASGNITDVGSIEYQYDERGRLVVVQDTAVVATLEYNTLGQRVQKTSGGSTTDYVYNLNGQLIGEYDDGTPIREYVHFQGLPVAQIEPTQVIYLHPDHLGSPRTGTDSSETVVWAWAGEAFGSALPDEDPDNDLTNTVVNLRFPGQYYDDETGLHYNYFRDYDPSTGRYVQSDPIGLQGGFNTYAYVRNMPTMLSDPFGLEVSICCRDTQFEGPLRFLNPVSPQHCFVKTDTYESGLGGECEVPAQGCSDNPYDDVQTIDHTGQSEWEQTTCEVQQNVDEQCVDELIAPGQPQGRWHPFNQCQSFAYGAVSRCRYGPQIGPVLPPSTYLEQGPIGQNLRPAVE